MKNVYSYNMCTRVWLLTCLLVLLMPLRISAQDIIGPWSDWWSMKYMQEINKGSFTREAMFEGEGTESRPYLIKDVWDLCRLEDKVNVGQNNFIGKYFELQADIDLTGGIWVPIGVNGDHCFAGIFKGEGYTIKGMHTGISSEQAAYNGYVGLFGSMKGVVRDLKLTDASITIAQGEENTRQFVCAGLLCGYVGYDTAVSVYGIVFNCDVQGTISGKALNIAGKYDATYAGGLVGYAQNPCGIYHSHSSATIDVTNVRDVGGLIGHLEGYPKSIVGSLGNTNGSPKETFVYDCTADADINVTASSDNDFTEYYTGGLVGWNAGGAMLACATTGNVVQSCALSYVGGICGRNDRNIFGCAAMTNVTGGMCIGGIVGKNHELEAQTDVCGTIVNSVYSGHLDGSKTRYVGGIVGDCDGNESQTVSIVRNSLFLGTIAFSNTSYKHPIIYTTKDNTKGSSVATSYSDVNLFDDGNDLADIYRLNGQLTNGDPSEASFLTKYADYKPLWKAYKGEDKLSVDLETWQYSKGFYPRLKVDYRNIINGSEDVRDYVLASVFGVRYFYGSDTNLLFGLTRFPAYAWLASVPAPLGSGLSAQHVDGSFSLKHKEQTIDDKGTLKWADYKVADGQTVLTVSGETATPVVDKTGTTMLTATITADKVSKQWCIDVDGTRRWNGKTARGYDGGTGTQNDPFLLHSPRQLVKAFTSNSAGQYYKLQNDIWFNKNLLGDTGEPVLTFYTAWDHQGDRTYASWAAHLDGDGHLVRGIAATNAYALFGNMTNDASIENTGFVDCYVSTPTSESGEEAAFLAPIASANAAVRNCLFHGVFSRTASSGPITMGGLFHTIGGAGSLPYTTIEDCVVAVVNKSTAPSAALFYKWTPMQTDMPWLRRVLILNSTNTSRGLVNNTYLPSYTFFPEGYLTCENFDISQVSKPVSEMTDGTFFADNDKWTTTAGRFPMLKSFAATAYGRLLALPIYSSNDNSLTAVNYILEFEPSRATWRSSASSVAQVDTDTRVIEAMAGSGMSYIVRTMDDAKVITPIHTAATITEGIKFADDEAKKFCLTYFDSDGNGAVSMSELKAVTADALQTHMTKDDGNPSDNDGDAIVHFPEFRYFGGVDALGSSFHGKDKLEEVRLSGHIKTLEANAFMGNKAMKTFNVPTSITAVEAHPFYQSGLENYTVESDHGVFSAHDGLLMNKDGTQLISYPNGRQGTSIYVPENVRAIAPYAVYKMEHVDTVFIRTADYDYNTVVSLAEGGITHVGDNGDERKMVIMVEDATNDDQSSAPELSAARRAEGSETGEGNGHLLYQYRNADGWKEMTVSRYWDLDISKNSKDANGIYWGTMYIGFDTTLPEYMRAYTVDKQSNESSPTLVLRKLGRKVPMMTPVVIRSEKWGLTTLYPSRETKWDEFPMSENYLDGVGRNGMNVYQSDANDGGCLVLGRNSEGKVGFFIYKGKDKIPPFHAYISVNKIGNATALLLEDAEVNDNPDSSDGNNDGSESATRIEHPREDGSGQPLYTLGGRRMSGTVKKGIYVTNGRSVVVK